MDVDGPRRIKTLLSGGTDLNPKGMDNAGRKTVRGNTISDDIVQISVVVAKKGKKNIDELLQADEE